MAWPARSAKGAPSLAPRPLQGVFAAAWLIACLVTSVLLPVTSAQAQTRLLNATFEGAVALFQQIDAAFAADYKKQTGRDVRVETRAAPAADQLQAVRDGLAADVVALADPATLDALAAADFVAPDWRARFPQQAAPWGTTVLFAVRPGNPKRIRDWADLGRAGVRVLLPDPAIDPSGRFGWLGAWGAFRKQGRTEAQAAQLAGQLLKNAMPLAASAQAARDAFGRKAPPQAADVLVLLESDLPALRQGTDGTDLQLVHPRFSVLVEYPVATVERVTRKKGTGELAKAYLNYLFTPPAQALAAAQGLHPLATIAQRSSTVSTPTARKPDAGTSHQSSLFTVAEVFGSLGAAEQQQFGAAGWLARLQAKAVR